MTTFWCPYCEKNAETPNDLWQHVKKKHPSEKKAHLRPPPPEPSEGSTEWWREWKEGDKIRKAENLAKADPKGWTIHCETHWSQKFMGDRIDYWPTRNKFRWRKKTYTGDVVGFMSNRLKKFLEEHGPV